MNDNSIDQIKNDIDVIGDDEELKASAIRYFNNIISEELKKKTEEQDLAMIDDCIKQIALLKGVKAEFTEDELAEKAQQAINGVNARTQRKRIRFKSLIAAAAVVVILSSSVIGVYGFNPTFRDWVVQLLNLPFGMEIEDSGITFYLDDKTKMYADINELMKEIDIDIYYPSKLPNGLTINNIRYISDKKIIIFVFDNAKCNINIDLEVDSQIIADEYDEIYYNDKMNLYIRKTSDNSYLGIAQDNNNNKYTFITKEYETLIFIFDNLMRN